MNHGQMIGWIVGIGGGVLGMAGGIFGTWCSIRNTSGPRERAFVVKASILCWLLVITFIFLQVAVPFPHKWLLWSAYAILLPLGVAYWNRRQRGLRQEESANRITS
jgi:hypothetical protein